MSGDKYNPSMMIVLDKQESELCFKIRNIVSLASVCRKITSVQRNVVVIHQRTQAKPYISVPQVANLSKERDG